jgi:hypothetical protein
MLQPLITPRSRLTGSNCFYCARAGYVHAVTSQAARRRSAVALLIVACVVEVVSGVLWLAAAVFVAALVVGWRSFGMWHGAGPGS